ncbi:MAG: hypothetical protein K9J13_13870 [Saprospiraceae bacterium]|nr:hypothetical protein [Saprospiraceae bacterium]
MSKNQPYKDISGVWLYPYLPPFMKKAYTLYEVKFAEVFVVHSYHSKMYEVYKYHRLRELDWLEPFIKENRVFIRDNQQI